MNCPRCAKPNDAAAAYCMNCGTQLPQATPAADVLSGTSMSPVNSMQEQLRRRAIIVYSLVAVAAAIGAIFVTKSAGLWGANGSVRESNSLEANGSLPNSKVLEASGSLPNAVTARSGNASGAVTGSQAVAPEKMPQDVYEWLKHLEKCEAKKVEISGNQIAEVSVLMQKISVLGAGMGLMDPYDQSSESKTDADPSTYTKGKIADLRPDWVELYKFYRSVPPPPECVPIAEDFDKSLSEIPGMMGDLGDVLNSVQANPADALKQLKKLQNSSYSDIDRYFSRCDEKVNQICDKYHMHKWFNIKSDVMAGGVLGKLYAPTGGG